jgi:hypothetical protein
VLFTRPFDVDRFARDVCDFTVGQRRADLACDRDQREPPAWNPVLRERERPGEDGITGEDGTIGGGGSMSEGGPVSVDEATRPGRRTTLRRAVDIGFWLLLVSFLGWRFGPHLLVATGAGDAGAPAPPFAFTTLDGDTVTLEALAGKVVVVNSWATWCGPCRLEMPALESVWRERRDDGLVILGLSTDRTGAIRHRVVGYIPGPILRAGITRLLNEPPN